MDRWPPAMSEPAPLGGKAGITTYLHALWLGREDLQRAYPDLDGPDGPRLVEWAHLFGRHEVPIPDALLPPRPAHLSDTPLTLSRPAPSPGRWGVNLAGHLRGELGLGEAARLVVRALDAARIPAFPVDIGSANSFRCQDRFLACEPGPVPFPATVVCANPDSLWSLARRCGPGLFEDRHTIGIWWWEAMGGMPIEWVGPAGLVDEVWAGSRFVAGAVAALAPGPVGTLTLPVGMPPPRRPERARLGLPEGFLFLFTFDYNSTLRRKNPTAVIQAFAAAFPPGSGAALVLKSIGGDSRPDSVAMVEAAAAHHPDIHLIDGWLDAADGHALTACCDCYVSLHRSEGFGLTIAEAMYLGKPTIATGYGGNLDFMRPDNSFLVDWLPARVGEGSFPYPPAGDWAEPDLEHAAALMRRVFDDPATAAIRGRRGAQQIRHTHSLQSAAASITALLEPTRARAHAAGRVALPGATEAAAAIRPAGRPALERAGALAEAGAEHAFVPRGRLRRLVRRLLLRLLRPLSAYEQALARELLGALREAQLEQGAAERRALERHAGLLGALRETGAAGRADAVGLPLPPALEDRPHGERRAA